MLWLVFGVMLFAASLVVAIPLYRNEKHLSSGAAISIVALVGLSTGMYSYIGSPNVDPGESGESGVPDVDAMVSSLASRLENNPDDVAGWKMLGRSYLQLKNFPGAVTAYEKAVELENNENGQTLADLGEAILMGDGRTLNGRAGQLFKNALGLEPNNPKALFYSGLAAMERGENELAATRWETLLATSPPPNIEVILRERIATLRGTAPQPPQAVVGTPGPSVVANVSLGEQAVAANIPESTVFIIARDPNQPSPPIAAIRRQLSELPAEITLSDADAMIPGRVPSAFQQLEIIARISLSGQPVAQSGDWYGEEIVETPATESVQILINQRVP